MYDKKGRRSEKKTHTDCNAKVNIANEGKSDAGAETVGVGTWGVDGGDLETWLGHGGRSDRGVILIKC